MWFRRLKTIDAHLEGGIPPDVREAKAPIKSVWMDTDIVGGRLPGNKQNTMTQVTSAELPCACNILRAAKAAVTLLTPQKPCLLRHAKGDAIDDEEWCMASVLPVPSPLHRMHKKRGLHAARDVCGRATIPRWWLTISRRSNATGAQRAFSIVLHRIRVNATVRSICTAPSARFSRLPSYCAALVKRCSFNLLWSSSPPSWSGLAIITFAHLLFFFFFFHQHYLHELFFLNASSARDSNGAASLYVVVLWGPTAAHSACLR